MTSRITTVIPTFRRPALLQRAVRSALEQGEEVRVHVLDNASGDLTGPLLRQWSARDKRLIHWAHSENIGGIANFEAALDTVHTEFFSILSDDDYLLPNFYRKAIAALDEHPEAMFWAGTTLHVDERHVVFDARVARWARHGAFDAAEALPYMTGGMAPSWTGIVFRKEVLDSLGLPDRQALGPGDLDFVLRAAARFPCIVEDEAVAVFTLNPASFSATQPLSSFWPGWLHVIAKARVNADLTEADRNRLSVALLADARRMLFRRGIKALTIGRHDFVVEATRALRSLDDGHRPARWLAWAEWGASWIPGLRLAMACVYRNLEKRVVRSRGGLQSTYGPLLVEVGPLPEGLGDTAEGMSQ